VERCSSFLTGIKTINTLQSKLQAFIQLLGFRIITGADVCHSNCKPLYEAISKATPERPGPARPGLSRPERRAAKWTRGPRARTCAARSTARAE
jgi:hypothetical protein